MGIFHTMPWRPKSELMVEVVREAFMESKRRPPLKRRRPARELSQIAAEEKAGKKADRRKRPRLPFQLTLVSVAADDKSHKAPPRSVAQLRLRVTSRAGFVFFRAWWTEAGILRDSVHKRRRVSPLVELLFVDPAVLRLQVIREALKDPSRGRTTGPVKSDENLRPSWSQQQVSQFDQRDRAWRGHRG
jgi:hypothetical protein